MAHVQLNVIWLPIRDICDFRTSQWNQTISFGVLNGHFTQKQINFFVTILRQPSWKFLNFYYTVCEKFLFLSFSLNGCL